VGCTGGRGGVGGGADTAGGCGGAAGGAVNVGRTVGVGTTIRGAGGAGGAGGAAGFGAGDVVTGGVAAGFFTSAGGAAGGRGTGGAGAGGAAAGACCLRIAERTSPGREMWDRSILVFISSAAERGERAVFAAACGSVAEPRKRARTFSASCSSRELECVFFSVTPTSGSTSRIALLLTSNSLARSLIRILLIRPFIPPQISVKSSYQPHGYYFFRFEKVYSFVSEDAGSSCDSCVSAGASSSERSEPVAESAPGASESSCAGDSPAPSSITCAAGS